MHRVGKIVPPKREILRTSPCRSSPGAKIGVLGLNGAAIHPAGSWPASTPRSRRARCRDQRRLPPQGAKLTPGHRARHRRRGRRPDQAGPGAAGRVYGLSRAGCDFDTLAAEQASWAILRASDGHNLEPLESPPCACCRGMPRSSTCPAAKAPHKLYRLLLSAPHMLLLDEPTNHLDADSVAWLEHFLHDSPRHCGGDHPRPLLPRQRRRLDPRTRPWPWHPFRRQLLRLAGIRPPA